MNKLITVPVLITIVQIVSFGHLYYVHKYKSGQFPADLIELNILAFLNIIIMILAYFFYFKASNKDFLWMIPIGFAILTIILLIVIYLVMLISKYK